MSRSTFGPQPNSKRSSAPAFGFATATRDQTSKVFFSQEDEKPQRRGVDHSVPPPPPKMPASVTSSGRTVAYWNQTQLEQTDRTALRRRAQVLQDVMGAENLPSLPHHPAEMIRWILQAQVTLSQTSGRPMSLAEFGVSALSAEERGELYFGGVQDKWIKNPAAAQPRLPSGPENPRPPTVGHTTEALGAYAVAKERQAANKQRNIMGSGIFS